MFRASQISSEETLPVFGDVSITSTDIEHSEPNSETSLKIDNRQPFSYGLINPPQRNNKYPVAVLFVLLTKFFEALAANGIRTILVLYLRDDLYFSESFSTVMLHIFNFFGQFCPIFGAILADNYIGNVRTISIFCFLYAFGWILLTVTSVPGIGASLVFLVSISLLCIAIGNGSIRACITSLGAIQFRIPEQTRQLTEYFTLYYFVYYFGIFLSKVLPPLVRSKTHCFNKSNCYSAVFGTLGTSFFSAWLFFTLGKVFYKPEKLFEENILFKCYDCVKYALVKQWRNRNKRVKPTYWLQNAIGQYDKVFVNDVAKALKISKLFLPLPIYFALLTQQDSSWTFQASMMNTTIAHITFQPDQAKAMGPIFLFVLIPLWQYICTPLMNRFFHCEIHQKPLNSVAMGGLCSAFSFICAGILQKQIFNRPYKSVNIAWQIPQFLLIMMGELLLSIPGLKFAFTEAPASMKSVVTATWFLNNAFGNLIVVIITELNVFTSQTTEYYFYAVLMVIAIIVFIFLAYDYVLEECSQSVNNMLTPFEPMVEIGDANEQDNKPSTSTGI